MIDVNLFNNEGTIYFTVTNEGHTIPESVQPHLFDVFISVMLRTIAMD